MKFSLIIFSYNPDQEWLRAGLKTAEGLFDEIIIVDDGSYSPIPYATVRHRYNMGVHQARNSGVAVSTGDIIAWLDDDDLLIPEVVPAMKQFVIDNYDKADLFPHTIEKFGDKTGKVPVRDISIITQGNPFPGCTWYKREVWYKTGGYAYHLAEDWDFFIKANKLGLRFLEFDPEKIFYRYRKYDGSFSSAFYKGNNLEIIRNEILINNGYIQS